MLEGESLGGFDHVQTLMTRSVSAVLYIATPWTLNSSCHQCLHVIKAAQAFPLRRLNMQITRMKQRGGGEPGDEATRM